MDWLSHEDAGNAGYIRWLFCSLATEERSKKYDRKLISFLEFRGGVS